MRHCFALFAGRGVWNGFLLGKVRGEIVPSFCGGAVGDGHLF